VRFHGSQVSFSSDGEGARHNHTYGKLCCAMLTQETITFLKRLDRNNNREWLQMHKPDFERAKEDFARFVSDLLGRISKFDPKIGGLLPESCTFRIYRDVRFSKDKKPYKTNFGAYLSPGGRKSAAPGYYFHLQPGQSFLAAGKYNPEPGELLKIRTAIAAHTDEFLKIIRARNFRKCFGEIHGQKLKTAPKGFPKDHEAIEYLKLKNFLAFLELHDETFVISKELPAFIASTFKETKPLIDFLRTALTT
jgi:uncharacterized protein (TIGR02453 family)